MRTIPFVTSVLLMSIFFISCEKDNNSSPGDNNPETEYLNDSVYYYTMRQGGDSVLNRKDYYSYDLDGNTTLFNVFMLEYDSIWNNYSRTEKKFDRAGNEIETIEYESHGKNFIPVSKK